MIAAFWTRFDPRGKVVFLVGVTAAALVASPRLLGMVFIPGLLLLCAGGGPIRLRRALAAAAALWVLTVLWNALFHPGTRLGPEWLGPLRPSVAGARAGAAEGLTLVALAALGGWAAFAVSAFEVIGSVEWSVRRSPRLRRRVHELAFPTLLALRLIPLLVEEAGRLGEVERLRFGPRSPFRRLARIPALAPLWTLGALDRAHDLALALRLRGYRAEADRGFVRTYAFRAHDAALSGLGLLAAAAAVAG